MHIKFVDNLWTCRTFFRIMVGFIWTSPWPTAIILFPLALEIFLLLGHEEYVAKYLGKGVAWSIALESKI